MYLYRLQIKRYYKKNVYPSDTNKGLGYPGFQWKKKILVTPEVRLGFLLYPSKSFIVVMTSVPFLLGK
jgi:hypothetical protein